MLPAAVTGRPSISAIRLMALASHGASSPVLGFRNCPVAVSQPISHSPSSSRAFTQAGSYARSE